MLRKGLDYLNQHAYYRGDETRLSPLRACLSWKRSAPCRERPAITPDVRTNACITRPGGSSMTWTRPRTIEILFVLGISIAIWLAQRSAPRWITTKPWRERP